MHGLTALFLLIVVRSTHQALYSCDPTTSCGCSRNSASVNRIVGGETASDGTWSWAVSLIINGNYQCGASIMSSSWIITAAHCVHVANASQVIVYAGATSRSRSTQIRNGSRIIVHPGFIYETEVNDIALIQLATPLVMTDPNVNVVCLPAVSKPTLANGGWPSVGTSVVAVGWGLLNETDTKLPTLLQQVTVQIVDDEAATCKSANYDRRVQLCAGVSGGGKDACEGDSGGPLMMFGPTNQWILVGVTSSGIGCARAENSGTYVRVAAFQDWIQSYTNSSMWIESGSGSVNPTMSTMTTSVSHKPTRTMPSIGSHANIAATSMWGIVQVGLLGLWMTKHV